MTSFNPRLSNPYSFGSIKSEDHSLFGLDQDAEALVRAMEEDPYEEGGVGMDWLHRPGEGGIYPSLLGLFPLSNENRSAPITTLASTTRKTQLTYEVVFRASMENQTSNGCPPSKTKLMGILQKEGFKVSPKVYNPLYLRLPDSNKGTHARTIRTQESAKRAQVEMKTVFQQPKRKSSSITPSSGLTAPKRSKQKRSRQKRSRQKKGKEVDFSITAPAPPNLAYCAEIAKELISSGVSRSAEAFVRMLKNRGTPVKQEEARALWKNFSNDPNCKPFKHRKTLPLATFTQYQQAVKSLKERGESCATEAVMEEIRSLGELSISTKRARAYARQLPPELKPFERKTRPKATFSQYQQAVKSLKERGESFATEAVMEEIRSLGELSISTKRARKYALQLPSELKPHEAGLQKKIADLRNYLTQASAAISESGNDLSV